MEIKEIDILKIKPYNKNPRRNEETIEQVKNSIEEFGFKVPILLDKDYTIIAGHTRYEASLKLGLKTVPCIIITDLNKEQVKAFRLADNKVSEVSKWDYELLEQELKNIIGIDMEKYDFLSETIDWNEVDEIDIDNYEKPEEKRCQCPYCNHEDSRMRFKKV